LKENVPRLMAWSEFASLPAGVAGGYFGLAGDELVYSGGTTWVDGTKQWLHTTKRHTGKGWADGPPLPRGMAYGSCVQRPGGMEIYAGTDGLQVYGGCWRLSANGQEWQQIGEMQRPILLSQAVVVEGRVILSGGAVDAGLSSFTDQVWAGEGSRWAVLGRLPHGRVALAASVMAGDRRMYIFGGCSAGPVNRNDAFRFDIEAGSWEAVRQVPITARGTAGVALDNRYILLAGGYSEGGFSRRCFLYDSEADVYHDVADLPLGLSGPAILRVGEFVYVCGGEPQMRERSPLVLRARIMR